MVLSAKLQVRQTQSLVITPQLMQAIRLLQMSGLELERFIDGEVEQNPLLDRGEDADAAALAPAAETDGDIAEASGDIDAEPADIFPEEAGSDFGAGPSLGSRMSAAGPAHDDLDREFGVAAEEGLAELLERRIEGVFAGVPADRAIASVLLAELDECGYVAAAPDAVAARLGVAAADVEQVLARCQALAPAAGLFARSLAECLALQLAERDRLDPAMRLLLDNLPRLAVRDKAGLCLLCGVDRNDLEEMIAEIRALDPKPGLAFHHEVASTVAADVFVRAASNGSWTVELNDATLPRLIVDRVYFARVAAKCAGDADKRYMTDCLQKASWLEKSLDQRARTVLKVAVEIVRRQEGFLAEGVALLKPLNLRMVADALGVHESTVSRAAANKYIATPRGIFEFRFFFTGAIPASTGGEAHSAEAVRHRIRKMIGDESPDAILSDDAIVLRLAREGVEIARRTVAKYREIMRIGSSVERRRQTRLRRAS